MDRQAHDEKLLALGYTRSQRRFRGYTEPVIQQYEWRRPKSTWHKCRSERVCEQRGHFNITLRWRHKEFGRRCAICSRKLPNK